MAVRSRTQRVLGYDMISRKCAEAYEAYFRGEMLCQSSRCNLLGVSEGNELQTYARKIEDKGRIIMRSTSSGSMTDDDDVVKVLQGHRGFTESTRQEEEVSALHALMAHTEWLASLGARSAALAHELRQPLTVVNLSLDDALDRLREASSNLQSATEGLKDALTQVPNLTSIVGRFRDLGKDSSDEPVTEVDVRAVAERVAKLFDAHRQQVRIVLKLGRESTLPPVTMNERDLEQVFFALFENAVHAADGKVNRQLVVNGVVEDHRIELSFCDNCGGIPPENLSKIFEPLFTAKPKRQGTGLGLCLVRHIVSRVGGVVRVESKFGSGSTFVVILPLNESRAEVDCGAAHISQKHVSSVENSERSSNA